jgi:pimeloyl-ACP methyl ester carboxylesterase
MRPGLSMDLAPDGPIPGPPTGRAGIETAPGILAAGPRDAPAIVFVHGARLSRTMWLPQLEALGGEFRAIAVDLPAHGARAGEPFSLPAARAVVTAAIRGRVASGRAIVVGLSLGGYVAIDLAAREPDLVRGLVLTGATAEPVGLRTVPYLTLAKVLGSLDEDVLARLDAWSFRTRFPPAIAASVVSGAFWPRGGAQALRAVAGQRFIPRLAAYPGPTLILNGQYDIPFRLFAGSFARAARDPRRIRLAGATHLASLDRPAAFSEAVRRFARSLPD